MEEMCEEVVCIDLGGTAKTSSFPGEAIFACGFGDLSTLVSRESRWLCCCTDAERAARAAVSAAFCCLSSSLDAGIAED